MLAETHVPTHLGANYISISTTISFIIVYKVKISMSFNGWSFTDLIQALFSFLPSLALSFQVCNLVIPLRLVPRDRHLEWGRVMRGTHV